MSFLVRGFTRFWFGTGKSLNSIPRHPPPWPAPRPPRFRPTPPPKPTTLLGKVKSYIPGRRWLIFGGIVSGWMTLAAYDRRERKAAVARWCRKVEHLSWRKIEPWEDIPSVDVWIAAPPGDQLKWNKEVWRDYVKPIIVAAGYDYSLHLNSKQGMTRITLRRAILEDRRGKDLINGTEVPSKPAVGGNIIVLGRNTFKEVTRGIHEGLLLHLDYEPPSQPPPEPPKPDGEQNQPATPPPPNPVDPAIPPSQYISLPDPPETIPEYIYTYIPSLHILGIRHTPKRIYRFLTRRHQADAICEQVVACILDQQKRDWTDEDTLRGVNEERYWPKTIKPDAEWREHLILDPRVRRHMWWRIPSEVQEVPDYRESSAAESSVKVEELVPTDDEIIRDDELRATTTSTEAATTPTLPLPWIRK